VFQYIKARTILDLNASYQLTKRWSLSASVNNIFNVPQTFWVRGSATPAYAWLSRFVQPGVAFGAGIRGTF
jgi:outer membrane receptor protein involved in Fe transport